MNKTFDKKVVLRLLEEIDTENSDSQKCINLLSFSKVHSQEFKYVYIPALNEKNLPRLSSKLYFISQVGNEKISSVLKRTYPDFDGIIETDENGLRNELFLFYQALTKAEELVTLSFHSYEDKKKSTPSVFFQLLKEVDFLNYEKIDKKSSEKRFALLKKNKKKKNKNIFEKDDILKLNPSSISAFLSCPRKFFFKNVLNLKEDSAFKANYGTAVHFILEVFNSCALENYTKEKILSLSDALFDSKNNLKEAQDTGFSELATNLINACDDLSLLEMKKKFVSAAEDMEKSGFFETPPAFVVCERPFEFELPGVENVLINGKIDAIVEKSGKTCIVDYKTGKNKKSLAYYLSDYGLNFEGDSRQYKGVFNENNVKNYEYQVPVYYLALQNAPELAEFKDKADFVCLNYIRPQSEDEGYFEDMISASQVEEKKEKLIENLKNTVIDKIRQRSYFEKTTEIRRCENCSYAFLCSKEDVDASEE